VIPGLDLSTIYEAPIRFHEQEFDTQVLNVFGIADAPEPDLSRWNWVVDRVKSPEGEVKIAVVGKYMQVKDSYKSLSEALTHGGLANNVHVSMEWIDSEIFERADAAAFLENVDGILVPGGFGERGTEGKIAAVKFAREHKVPFFGICYGLHMAVIEAARDLAGLEGAGTTEIGNPRHPVIGLMTEWTKGNGLERREEGGDLGGTMRLGAYPANLSPGSRVAEIYGSTEISERHRHRYEVNLGYVRQLGEHGLAVSGWSPDRRLPEILEISDHPWFIGVQFHPELKSRPLDPHPLFASFIAAAIHQSRLV
jgi:CTP synthase